MTLGRTKTKEEVIEALHSVAAEMHDKMLKGKPPAMTLPVSCLLYTSPSPRDS